MRKGGGGGGAKEGRGEGEGGDILSQKYHPLVITAAVKTVF